MAATVTVPRYNLKRIVKLRDKLTSNLKLYFAGTEPTGDDFQSLVDLVAKHLPKNIDRITILDSLRPLLGRPLTEKLVFETAWLLAGNLDKLKHRISVTPWDGQLEDEWIPVQIIASKPGKNRFGEYGYLFTYRVMAGSPCPMIIRRFWSNRFCRYISKEFGFSNSWGKTPMRDASELVSMRLFGLISADKSIDYPFIDKVQVSSSHLIWNRSIIQMRARLNGFTCPNDYTHACYKCPVGYADCPAAVHPNTYLIEFCNKCNQESYFDPANKSRLCVDCLRAGK